MAEQRTKKFLKHFEIEFDDNGTTKKALIHVYLDEDKLTRLGAQAGRNLKIRARSGPLECRAYKVK